MTAPLVELRGLTRRSGARTALDSIDLVVEQPEILGVVGPDGAGKTTLLRCLAGLLEVEASAARVLGCDLRGDVSGLKARLGYVPQTFGLHRELSVAESLEFTARLHRLDTADARHRADELLARTGLTPFAARPAGALSGGMRQKLAIANALLPRPRLLVLDEPTAGVDVVARGEIWSILTEEATRALVVTSTSYLDEAAACHRLAYLHDGRLLALGTPDELRARVPLAVYRVWSTDVPAVARRVRSIPWVRGARATGRYVRVEVDATHAPEPGAVQVMLDRVSGDDAFVEPIAVDMEAALLTLGGIPA